MRAFLRAKGRQENESEAIDLGPNSASRPTERTDRAPSSLSGSEEKAHRPRRRSRLLLLLAADRRK